MSKKAEVRSKTAVFAVHRKVSDVSWRKHSGKILCSEQPAICALGPLADLPTGGKVPPAKRLIDSGSFVNVETSLKKSSKFTLLASNSSGSIYRACSDVHHCSLLRPRHLCMISDTSHLNMPASRESNRSNELV